MAKYNNALAVLLNNGKNQILPVSKAQLIELAYSQSHGEFGTGAKDVAAALTYLLNKSNRDLQDAKTYTGEQINTLNGFAKADTGYVLSYVVEENGVISKQDHVWLDASVVSYQGVGDGAPTTVQGAIEDIQTTLSSLAGDGQGSVQSQITNALDALDLAQVSAEGKPITYVSQENGQVDAGTGNIDSQYVDVDNSGNKFNIAGENPAETLSTQTTLEHLQGEISAAVGAAAKYTVNKVTTELPSNVGVRYQLMESINGGTATAVAQDIDIPADSTLVEVYLGASTDTVNATTGEVTKNTVNDPQSMNFVHKLADGTYSITKIDVSKFFTQSERGDGLVKTGATLSVGLDDSSESFLTVESDGIKLSGVQSAINTAENNAKTYADGLIAGLDSSVGAEYQSTDVAYVITGVTQTDGELASYYGVALTDANVKTTEFDSESDLYKLLGSTEIQNVTDVHTALNKIAGKVKAAAGEGVTEVVGDTNNTYINISAAKSGNTVTLTVDESALGNVAHLQYNELQSLGSNEIVTILGANPDE